MNDRKHADWVEEFLPNYPEITKETIDEILQKEVGLASRKRVPEDAGRLVSAREGEEPRLGVSFTAQFWWMPK